MSCILQGAVNALSWLYTVALCSHCVCLHFNFTHEFASRISNMLQYRVSLKLEYAPVAQLDRVPGFEPGCREFESLRARF